ncbi:(Fe-S)-binding protein [Streptomonospora nanhaiensis]|uniref:L-lactate dehydrogenase complex protein LldE n=1 Tax=Streptomonospora nanhaiensis TaxID=1323731 RepID=A0A853BF37_9ACTN|nr:(Fe-S)-binding protein [Streptomonospora nanhaiensis]MBV2364428.1 (Fe-S)-binding protein [Streptomonospora nanhaiensis]MBX9387871.1 (Fe-S)-binding protein [Streptomonospora nanhaiensis]NYI94058.1 L-lactate dehydrogenase complex protein LldE [Streptomonospora nanhaiensis]
MRIALFITCVNDTLYPRTGQAVVRLLRRLGHEVVFPESQTCCGQMHYNTGYRREAQRLAVRFVETFADADAVLAPSGSCAAMVRDNYPRLGEPGSRLDRAVADLAPRVYDLSELLVDVLGVTDVGAYFPHTVTYHPTCHGLRLLKLGDRPYRLLREVRGIDLRELPGAAECCGFGGTFAVKNPDVSAAMGSDKARNVAATGAEVLCAVDNSCLMHIGGTLERGRTGVKAVHLAEILASTEQEPARL